MTGIEQLRKMGADAVRGGEVGRAICDIADQIERERECDADTIENLRLELGEARDAIAWVREHGGLDAVKELLGWVVGHCSTRQQLDFDFWLSGRVMHELGFEEDMADRDEVERRLLARLMPEGMEWPRFGDGEPVRIGDQFAEHGGCENVVDSVEVGDCWFKIHGFDGAAPRYSKRASVKRPVADTWERLEEDCAKSDVDYCAERGLLDPSCDTVEGDASTRHCTDCGCTCGEKMARDLVRRCRALAERSE